MTTEFREAVTASSHDLSMLQDLPPELLGLIADFLNTIDFLALRSAAKSIERACSSTFSRRFFRKKGFMIVPGSLSVLAKIADHVELRESVQHLWFNPDCYTFREIDEIGAQTPSTARAFEACIQEHLQLMAVDSLSQLLTGILPKLLNLRVVGIRRGEDHAPWGWRRLNNQFQMDPRTLGRIPPGPAASLSGPTLVLQALINVTSHHQIWLKRLYTDAVEVDAIRYPSLNPQHMPFQDLKYLELTATKTLIPAGAGLTEKALTTNRLSDSVSGQGLILLLRNMPRLEELALQIFPDRKQSHMLPPVPRRPGSWKDSYQFLCVEKLSQQVHLTHLTRLKLEKLTASTTALQALILPCRCFLKSIKLRDIRLLGDSEIAHSRPWQPFFQFLARDCPSLKYVLFHRLLHEHGGVSFSDAATVSRASGLNSLRDAFGLEAAVLLDEASFVQYQDLTFEAENQDRMQDEIQDMINRHQYHPPIFSYHMDEDVWHTDTSDEGE